MQGSLSLYAQKRGIDLMSGFIWILITMLCYFRCLCAVHKFCITYLDASKRMVKYFVVFLFSESIVLNIVYSYSPFPHIFFIFLHHLLFIGLIVLMFQGDAEKKILAASILTITLRLVINFCEPLFSCLALFWLHTVKHIANPLVSDRGGYIITCAIYLITAFVISCMSKHLKPVFYCKTRKWYLMLAIPLLIVTAVFDVAGWGATKGILVRSGGNMGLYYDQILSYVGIGVLDMLSAFAVGFYLYGMERISLEQRKSSQYHAQIAAYKMLEEQSVQSERLRHDMKNHILALSELSEKKEWEAVQDYLKNMADNAYLESGEEITGNRVVDVLLYQNRQRAMQRNIRWECDVQMPKECDISAFDLCVLFGNILDNAREACERLQGKKLHDNSQQFIHIQAGTVKKCFLIEVKNSADMAGSSSSKNMVEKNGERHGIGLLNVHDVVCKYNGIMNTELQNGVFVISILIPVI